MQPHADAADADEAQTVSAPYLFSENTTSLEAMELIMILIRFKNKSLARLRMVTQLGTHRILLGSGNLHPKNPSRKMTFAKPCRLPHPHLSIRLHADAP